MLNKPFLLILVLISSFIICINGNNQTLKIIGGVESSGNKLRFVVSLQRSSKNPKFKHFCGGALIDPEWVLTAAHCVSKYYTERIRIGSYDNRKGGKIRKPRKIIIHPDFNLKTLENDIALIKLNRKVKKFKVANVINYSVPPNTNILSIGWGYTKPGAQYIQQHLREVNLHTLSNKECSSTFRDSFDNQTMMCTFGEYDHETGMRGDACSGDSGSPNLLFNEATGEVGPIVGLTSWGRSCGTKQYPGVIVRTSNFVSFIETTMMT